MKTRPRYVLYFVVAVGAALSAALCLVFHSSGPLNPVAVTESAKFDKPPIKAIMIRGFRANDTSLIGRLDKALQRPEVPWDDVQGDSAEVVELAKSLATFSPPKGAPESWTRLTGDLVQSANNLATAARKRDREVSTAERDRIAKSCSACHTLHR